MEKPVTPDEPDVLDALDAGDALQGLGVDVLASGSSSASGWLVISRVVVSGHYQPADISN